MMIRFDSKLGVIPDINSRVSCEMFIIACFLVLGVAKGAERVDPLVDTKQGIISGLRSDDGDYSMFLGIPFGKVNNNNPFGVATPYPKFEKTFLAHDDSAVCPQVEEFNNTIVGTLDCLHLNIFVPSVASSKNKLPVLIWIHGGSFQFGYNNRYLFGPKYLIRHDIILVTINYRMGPYGFMCLDTAEVPGNQGLKDQLLALRWIKNNIASFGGDNNKITLVGQSAGAASVEFHLWSKQEKLFNQAIMQSGSLFSPWAIAEPDLTPPIKLAKHLGYNTENISDALSFLAKTDVKSLIAVVVADQSMEFNVCVEKRFENVESILDEHPLNLIVPKARNMPILTGYNNHEWMSTYLNKPDSLIQNMNVFNKSLNQLFNYDNNFFKMEDIVHDFYIGDETISRAVQWNLIDFSTDYGFVYPIHKSIQKYLDNRADIYHYVFSYSGKRNFIKKRLNITEGGAAHSDELSFLFDMIFDPSTPSEEDQHIIDILTTLWTNFVKYGNPTPNTSELLPIKWSPVTNETLNYLNISNELTAGKRPVNDRIAFWDLFFIANKIKLKGYKAVVPPA